MYVPTGMFVDFYVELRNFYVPFDYFVGNLFVPRIFFYLTGEAKLLLLSFKVRFLLIAF